MLSGSCWSSSHKGGSWLWSFHQKEYPEGWSSLESHSCDPEPISEARRGEKNDFSFPFHVTKKPKCKSLFVPSHQCLQNQPCTTWISDWVEPLLSQNPPHKHHHFPERPQPLCGVGCQYPEEIKRTNNHWCHREKRILNQCADLKPTNLWSVCFNRRAALCSTVQGKMNERLNIWECHLVFNEGSCFQVRKTSIIRQTFLAQEVCTPEAVGLSWRKAFAAAPHLFCFLSGRHFQCLAMWKPLLQSSNSHNWRTRK